VATRPLRALRRPAELSALALVTLLVPIAAVGWLYLLRGGGWLPGPRVADALPLDELANRSSVKVILYVAVWIGAALTLGLLARAARIERLTAALIYALVVGALLFAATGVSIFVVRQIPAGVAFSTAARVEVVYVGATLVGFGGALLGARRNAGTRWPIVLACFAAASGLLDVASALTPGIDSRVTAIQDATPSFIPHLASALVVPAGLVLIVLARGLWRRRRRAWELTLVLVVAAAALHLLKGLDYEEAGANLLVAIALVARRHDFAGPGDPRVRVRLVGRAGLWLAAIFVYAFAALWVNRVAADRPFTLSFALKETVESLIGAELRASRHLSGEFGHWFPLSVFLLGVVGILWLLWAWLAPWRYWHSQEQCDRERAYALVASFGVDTLAPFALRADKSYFFSEDEQAFLAYKVVAGVAVVSGDPVGPKESVHALLTRFLAFARERDWRIAVLGAGDQYLDVYRGFGLRALYHGDEAVVHTREFSLDGRAIRKVRQSVARLEREGYRAEVLYARDADDDLRADLQDIFEQWRGDAPTKGFTMELDTLFRLQGDDAVFVIGRNPDGVPEGFLHFVVARPAHALSLSSMPRRAETPNGFNEWLVVTTIEWAKAHEFERVSMNFAPFAAILAPDPDETPAAVDRLKRRALGSLKGHGFQLENLLVFNRKFFPHWERRYVVFERPMDLPRVGLAGLAAEGYLPLAGSRTGE
jgi:lysyl-tRNA synthetase class 2